MQSDRDSTGLSARPVGLAIAGLGGFAESIADLVLDAQTSAVGPSLRLIAVGDPAARLPAFARRRMALEQTGIRVFDTFEEACGVSGVEAAWLPVPIHQHRRLTEIALGAGRHVMCEKPLAGSLANAQAMLAAQRSSGLDGLVGFHSLFHPQTLDIKRRLLDGEIGAIRGATAIAAWPRGSVYFGRNGWAGRRFVDGTPVMDSPANNAMAHFLMLAMFFLGDSLAQALVPTSVSARTWRAAPIEHFDTVDAQWSLPHGRTIRALLTHASDQKVPAQVFVHGERATWAWSHEPLSKTSLPAERVFVQPQDTRPQMVRRLASLFAGHSESHPPIANFEHGVAHATAVELLTHACPSAAVPHHVERFAGPAQLGVIHHIPGLARAMVNAAQTSKPLRIQGPIETFVAPAKTTEPQPVARR